MTDALVLDFDGTLYTNEDEAHRQFRDTVIQHLRQHGIDDPAGTMEAAAETSLQTGTRTSTLQVLEDELSCDIGSIRKQTYERLCTMMEPSKVLEYLDSYQTHYRTSIFTNNEEQLVQRFLRHNEKTVDTIIGAETLSQLKPEPGAFRTFLETVPYRPAQAIFIDNDAENRDTAASLGFQTCRPAEIETVIG